jgi:hypothetical protein
METECNKTLSGYQPHQFSDGEERDSSRNVGIFAFQPPDASGTPREFYLTQFFFFDAGI